MAVDVLAHESWHLRGIIDEAETECRSLQTMAWTAQQLGATPEQGARAGARAVRGRLPRHARPLPRPARCADGGALDLRPGRPALPLSRLLVHAPPARARRGSPRATTRRCRPASARAGSPAPSRSRRAAARRSRGPPSPRARARAPGRRRGRSRRPSRGRAPRPARAADADRPEQTLTTPRRAASREQPVRAHDVAHVGVVAPRVRVAGDDADRVVARLQPGGDLARERGERVERRLARPGVVERARARDAQPVRVGVEAGEQVAGGLRDRVRVLRPQRRGLVDRQRRRRAVDLAGGDGDDDRAPAPRVRTASSTLSVIAWFCGERRGRVAPRAADVGERGEVEDDVAAPRRRSRRASPPASSRSTATRPARARARERRRRRRPRRRTRPRDGAPAKPGRRP